MQSRSLAAPVRERALERSARVKGDVGSRIEVTVSERPSIDRGWTLSPFPRCLPLPLWERARLTFRRDACHLPRIFSFSLRAPTDSTNIIFPIRTPLYGNTMDFSSSFEWKVKYRVFEESVLARTFIQIRRPFALLARASLSRLFVFSIDETSTDSTWRYVKLCKRFSRNCRNALNGNFRRASCLRETTMR